MENEIRPEWNIDETKKKYWDKIRHPFNGGFEITQKCNFRCIHCYLQNGEYKDYLSLDEIKAILDKLAEKGVLFLYLTGGEVFSRADFNDIWTYAKQLGFVLEVLTNASLISEKHFELFEKYPPAKISISIYGASEETYYKVTRTKNQYSKVISNLYELKRRGLNFEIKFIGMRENYDDFYKVEALAKELDVEFSHSFEIFPAFGGKENVSHMLSVDEIIDFEESYEQCRKTWKANSGDGNFYADWKNDGKFLPLFACGCGTTTCVIDAEGYLLPCNKLRLKRFNLLRDSFDEAWDAYKKIKQIPAPEDYRCLTCKNIAVCNPCPAQNFLSTGKYTLPDANECLLSEKRNTKFR